MSEEAIKFKKNNPNLNYKKMSLEEFQKLPVHSGIINFKITETSFLMLNILNDDSSVVKFFWKNEHDLISLNVWYNISKEIGTFIDVGAHTGLYSLTSIKANKENILIIYGFCLSLINFLMSRINKPKIKAERNFIEINKFEK